MAQANIKVMDYTPQVLRQLEGNKRRALKALGTKAVELIQDGMDTLYRKPPIDTGALQAYVNCVERNGRIQGL